MAAKSNDALPVIEFPELNQDDPTYRAVLVGGKQVGTLRKSSFNPRMMYLKLDGVTWNNTPGARYRADAGNFPETPVTTFTQARQRIEQHYRDAAKQLASKQKPG